jgi:alpha-glucoside transport system substrate-binding protein
MKKATKFVALSAVAVLGLAGCAAESTTEETTSAAPAPAVDTLPAGDGAVTIFGGYGEADAANFQAVLTEFGEANGIEITFTSLASFDTDIKVKIEAGQEPDIALWPQPGGLKDLSDVLVPLNEVFDISGPQATLVPGWDTLAVVDGELYGLPVSANMKTLVFYNPAAFAANGYAVPTTDAELVALESQIKADGSGYPWCAGIESGGATGWAFTDWMEQYVLDYNGIEAYNAWIAGDLSFGSPEVAKAAEEVSKRLLADGQVNGGGVAMATDSFGNTAPLFETGGKAAGQCFMLRQGSFITGFMPEDIQAQIAAGDYSNVDVFALPAPEGAQDGVIGGGDLFAVFDGHVDQDVAKVAAFISSDEVLKYMVSAGAISPHSTFDPALYPNELNRKIGEAMAAAAVFGFDGSDQMPSEVNAEFWAAGTDYVAGRATWEEVAARIDGKY